ncbi:MAG: RNA polymerase sigma factor [Ruminococcus sp.]|nr:RNA polymerase sigma factor [Ruminococcus sp.]MDE6796490.1 RNA polymerase sigma factor [Ruminococcus sp.]
MTVDSKFYAGGDGKISALLNPHEQTINYDISGENINELIAGCSESREKLEKLYTMFKDSVFAIAFGITSDYHLSEDCVAETFVRLTQVKRFSAKKGDGKGFIITIARNVALEYRRKYKRETENSDIYIRNYGDSDKTVENSIYINHLLEYLTDKQRQVIVLKCCSELTFKEIAKIMKCPESTVKSRYRKAIAILQEKAGADK